MNCCLSRPHGKQTEAIDLGSGTSAQEHQPILSRLTCCDGAMVLEGDDVWFDAEDGGVVMRPLLPDIRLPDVTEMIDAGVPAGDVEGVSRLAATVGGSGPEPLCDPLTLLRFYLSNNRNVDAAAAMHRDTLQWRAQFAIGKVMALHGCGEDYTQDGSRSHKHGIDEWKWERRLVTREAVLTARHAFFGRLRQLNPLDGAPILVWTIGRADVAALEPEGLIDAFKRALVSHLEDTLQCVRALSLRERRLVHARIVIDVDGISISKLRYVRVVKEIAAFAFLYFPEVLSTVAIVRAPRMFTHIWRVISSVLPGMDQKVTILGTDFEEGLLKSGIPLALLPQFLGGQASDDEVCRAEPVPPGIGLTLADPPCFFHLN